MYVLQARMDSPGSEERDQRSEQSQPRTVTLTLPADNDRDQQKRSVLGAPETEVGWENSDEQLWQTLPEDLLPKIFARLPFRFLCKIRLLSKAWEAHLKSPSFQLEATPQVLSTWESYSPLFCTDSAQDARLVAYSSKSRRWERLLSLSYLFAEDRYASSRWQLQSIAGSILCLKQLGEPGERGLLVTNSVLKSWRILPAHGWMTPFLPAYEIIHLINSEEDSSTYKVICISQDSGIRDPHKRIPSDVPPQDLPLPPAHLRAEIYNSATGAWTVDESGPVVPLDLHNVSSVYVDGIVYFSLATSRFESFHLFAYNVMSGRWTPIPSPHDTSCSLVQLSKCGLRVMLLLSAPASPDRKSIFGPSTDDCNVSEGSIKIYEIGPDLKTTHVSGGPTESIQGVKILKGISGDEDSIYFQTFGRPLVVMFNVKLKLWSTVPVRLDYSNTTVDDSRNLLKMSSRYIGPCFNWTNSTFQPGSNSFVAP